MIVSVSESIQLGLDLATSLTILIAALSWYLTQRTERRRQRELGLIETTRAVAVENVNSSIVRLSKDFGDIIKKSLKVENHVDLYKSNPEDIADAIKDGKIQVSKLTDELSDAAASFGNFFESASQLRYIVFPSLHALGNEMNAVQLIRGNVTSIMHAYNHVARRWSSLLQELVELSSSLPQSGETDTDVKKQDLAELFESRVREVNSIILDPEYLDWTLRFVPNEDEIKFKEFVMSENRQELLEDCGPICLNACGQLLGNIRDQPEYVMATVILHARAELLQSRIECKEFLVSLCAVSSKLQQKSSSIKVTEIYEELSKETFFAVEKEIR